MEGIKARYTDPTVTINELCPLQVCEVKNVKNLCKSHRRYKLLHQMVNHL